MSGVLTMTDAAARRVAELVAARGRPTAGVRLAVRGRGCSGLSYALEFADTPQEGDDVVRGGGGVKVYIDPKAVMFLLGSEMDYVEEELESGFVFRNPNEKGRCGCGESFHV